MAGIGIIWILTAPPEILLAADLLSKNLLTTEASPRWYPSYFGFLTILNA